MDGRLELRDGRVLAWHEWGVAGGAPVLRLQGTPGSRLSRHARPDVWERLGVRVLMADRPGYGGSSRLPGRGLAAVADDLVELLDHLDLESVPVIGYSGGGPHVLALCARHPGRVRAASIVVGAAPIADEDLDALIGVNAESERLMREGGWDAVHPFLVELRRSMVDDPLGGFRAVMADAPAADREVMDDPGWQAVVVESLREALRQGAEGWADEAMATSQPWDIDLAAIEMPVVWWHGAHDRNVPFGTVVRLLAALPTVELRLWDAAGHFEAFHREHQLVQDLLERAHRPTRG